VTTLTIFVAPFFAIYPFYKKPHAPVPAAMRGNGDAANLFNPKSKGNIPKSHGYEK
jgi:hypothetical protein